MSKAPVPSQQKDNIIGGSKGVKCGSAHLEAKHWGSTDCMVEGSLSKLETIGNKPKIYTEKKKLP